jgi:hypothetical protein
MSTRAILLIVASSAALAAPVTPALAALGDEVAAGGAVAEQVRAGTADCAKLNDSDFEHLGEYVMERLVGSRAAHEAMNQRMAAMMGTTAQERMHQLMGRRYARCTSGAAGAGMMGGAGPMVAGMGGAAMMTSPDVSWMRNGSWRHMSRSQWRNMQRSWMGPGMMNAGHHAWGVGAVLTVVFGAFLLVVLLALIAVRRPRRREPPSTPAAA